MGKDTAKVTQINTTVPIDVYDLVKNKEHWHWNELIQLGIQAKQNMPHVLDRLHATEHTVEEYEKRIERMSGKISQLVAQIWGLENDRPAPEKPAPTPKPYNGVR